MKSFVNHISRVALLFLVMSTMVSCKFYKDVEVLDVEDVNITKFNKDLVEAEITLRIKNPNWYAVTLTQSDIDVFVNQKEMGKVMLTEKVKLPSKSVNSRKLVLRGNYKDIKGSFLDNLLSLLFANKADFQAKGFVTGKALLVKRKVPVDFSESIDLKGINK
ncbi:MAG: LEA type 2 family protein [Flavobacteriales bacterium]|jgi:LEA14-like dessication related protein|nr:LEA type 2 family protein [Flavobacteriales bacterium]